MGREAKVRAFRKIARKSRASLSPMAPLYAVAAGGLRARTIRRAYLLTLTGTFSIRALANAYMAESGRKKTFYAEVLEWAAARSATPESAS